MVKLPLTFTLLFIVLHVIFPSPVISQSINTEKSILLDIKTQLGKTNPPLSWDSSASPCDWPLVKCQNDTVTKLLLSNITIVTTIPANICRLSNLTTLDLSYNYIPGVFPTALYNCSKLKYLDLSQNYFVGSIPADVDRLSSSLEFLNLGANNFSGDIPPAIGRLSQLKKLYLYQNEFNGTFPKEIGSLSNLEVLGMAYNHKFVPSAIPEEFGNLKKLSTLWMTRANLIGEIPVSMENCSSLMHIDLAENALVGTIPRGWFLFKNLSFLYLYDNKLSGQIPSSVEALNLVEIDLAINNLNGSIPEEFGKLQNLNVLHLYFNKLTGEVPASIGLIPKLQTIRLFGNSLGGVPPPELGLHSPLSAFEVSDNQFTGSLPEHLCYGGVLLGVVAFNNRLSGGVPESLGNCSTLRTVQLYNNSFSGEIPKGLWSSRDMESLMLSDNSFSGELPSELAWNVSRLEISNNRFSGTIPIGASKWSQLMVFKASNNQLSGEIPVELTSLSVLAILLLDGNQLSGEIPSEIRSWRSLSTLNLSRNELSGQIPSAIASLPSLNYLDLSDNLLSGEIPPQLGLLRLNSLNLSSNKLSGKIPQQFENLAYENSFLNTSHLCADNAAMNLPSCNAKSPAARFSSKHLIAIIVLALAIILVAILLIHLIVVDYRKRKIKRDLAAWKLTSFQRLGFTEADIVSSLVDNNVIGSGGSGKVYRINTGGHGDIVAVKRIWNPMNLDHNLQKAFTAEVEILGTIRHANIVKLMCCISSPSSKLLVYEYMENQSLDQWLHRKRINSSSGSVYHDVLDWPTRLNIAIGAARGLSYMHHDCFTSIIHRDVKSSNILLDSKFNARIADFGLAKMLVKHGESGTVSAIAGSFGYLAPECAYTTKVNEKIDVYSFGVVLLELVTGREPQDGDENKNLAEWAWKHFGDGKSIESALDEEIKETCYLEEMIAVFKLGLHCTNSSPSMRPSMKEVLRQFKIAENYDGKKDKIEYDVAPLLGKVSSYKLSLKLSEEDDSSLVNIV